MSAEIFSTQKLEDSDWLLEKSENFMLPTDRLRPTDQNLRWS